MALVAALALVSCGDDDGSTGAVDAASPPARAAGPPPPLDWSCVGSVVWPAPTEPELTVEFTVTQSLSTVPVAGMTLRACERDDADCASPVFEGTSMNDGVVAGTLPLGTTGWTGYLDITGPGFVPMLIFTGRPVVTPEDTPLASVVGDGTFELLLSAAGVTAEELARALYGSLHDKLLTLPDATLVYPAHGAGSACGKNLSTETVSTIGEQRATNYALQQMSVEEFV